MVNIALDAMGGDLAPAAIVEGAVLAAKEAEGRFKVILTGPEERVRAELDRLGYRGTNIEIFHSPQEVAMDESPSQVLRNKPQSGLVTCVGLQKEGKADASISAGNSGAFMAACLMLLGRIGVISRPAIACVLPSYRRKVVMLDAGANVDEKPAALMNFGVCGSVYAESVLGVESPKVGLLNVGEEEKKGPEVLQEAYQLLKNAPINFVGNIEGRDILRGTVDVVVTPGYVGNVVLKLMEGFYELSMNYFGAALKSEEGQKFAREWDYSNIGGALLLGLNGTGVITHGRADARTIQNALETSYQLVLNKVSHKISEKLSTVNP